MKNAFAITVVLIACASAFAGGTNFVAFPRGTTNIAGVIPDLTNSIFVGRGRSNIFLAYYLSSKPPTHLAPEKALCLTNGITFKDVVDVLGPGWRPFREGIGLVFWPFTNGRTVATRLPHYSPNGFHVLTTNSFLWFTNFPGEWDDPKRPVPKPRYIVW